jgi:hypothetical protein
VRATENALLRNRAGEVGACWPTLRAQFGQRWTTQFAAWARGRPPRGSWRDGWDFARHLAATGQLYPSPALDLAVTEATCVYDGGTPGPSPGSGAPAPFPGVVIQIAGRVFSWT